MIIGASAAHRINVQVDRARFRRGIVRLVAVDADRCAVLEWCADRERRAVRGERATDRQPV